MTGRRAEDEVLVGRARFRGARALISACALIALVVATGNARAEQPAGTEPPDRTATPDASADEQATPDAPAGEQAPPEAAPNAKPANEPAPEKPRPVAPPSDADIARAKDLWTAGRQAYDVGRFDVAIQALEQAYQLSNWPKLPFSIAQAYRGQYMVDGNLRTLDRAIELYREYLRRVPEGRRRIDAVNRIAELEGLRREVVAKQGPGTPGAEPQKPRTQLMVISRVKTARAAIGDQKLRRVPAVREVSPGTHPIRVAAPGYITETLNGTAVEGQLVVVPVDLRPKPGTLTLSAPSGAQVAVDGKSVDRKALARGLEMPAGRYWVTVRQRGKLPWSRGLTLERGKEITLQARLETTRRRVASYYAFGTAAVLAAASGVTAQVAHSAQSDAEAIDARVGSEPLTPEDLAAYNRDLDRRDNWRAASYVFLGTAVAAGLTGAFLFFFDDPGEETPPQGGWQVTPTRGTGVAASWTRSF